ncbi:MAG: EVE domain-containing protein [Geminicoccaceae bacterium]|nr:EVE domain-containing protein [Geminicoccaceae bacterium]MCB9945144.1 EVE domain-containing protein [Geminicoccaceae bacterium]
MAHWLMKTEPGDYDWDRFVQDGSTQWDGVRNHQAAANMRAMKTGEEVFFYRSLKDPAIVGVMRVIREAYPAPDDDTGKFVQVDLEPLRPVKNEVPLKAIKAEPALEGLALIRQSRLSVMPVSDRHWTVLTTMAGL